MDIVTISIGAVFCVYGLYTGFARVKAPEKLTKLQSMKDKFGAGAGTAIHTLAYSVLPILFAALVINAGKNGVSIMQFLGL